MSKSREAVGTDVAKVTALPVRAAANTAPHDGGIARNPGMTLDLGFMESMRNVNRSALERRVASMTKRRSIKADNQADLELYALAREHAAERAS